MIEESNLEQDIFCSWILSNNMMKLLHTIPSQQATSIPSLVPANWTPGRTPTVSIEEAPIPLSVAEPSPLATSSRSGPTSELVDGVFRTSISGKYDDLMCFPYPESIVASSPSTYNICSIQRYSVTTIYEHRALLSRREHSTP